MDVACLEELPRQPEPILRPSSCTNSCAAHNRVGRCSVGSLPLLPTYTNTNSRYPCSAAPSSRSISCYVHRTAATRCAGCLSLALRSAPEAASSGTCSANALYELSAPCPARAVLRRGCKNSSMTSSLPSAFTRRPATQPPCRCRRGCRHRRTASAAVTRDRH
jgi:hypothetical protein